MKVLADGERVRPEDVVRVARGRAEVEIASEARDRVGRCRAWLDRIIDEDRRTIYGLNTGFGPLKGVRISKTDQAALSRNLIVSHSVGVGPCFPDETVRAAMFVRLNTLCKGLSGIRLEVLDVLTRMVNLGVTPRVPSKGSLGASGDLAPLAHIMLVLCRDPEDETTASGWAQFDGKLWPGHEAMSMAGIPRVVLTGKEGVALINGTAVSAGLGALNLYDAQRLLNEAEAALALSLEALRGFSDAYDDRVQVARGLEGQRITAANVRSIIAGSKLVDSRPDDVQDAYTLRCAPQVLGAARDTVEHVARVVAAELNAANDSPLVFPEDDVTLSCGNFHGEPIAMVMDFLAIAMTEVASISERRTCRLIDSRLSGGLPEVLFEGSKPTDTGLNSGFLMPQYTAAALVADSKVLSHPDSVDSLTSGNDQEDHVSMSTNAARHAEEVLRNAEYVVAIEALCAAQALDLWRIKRGATVEQICGRGTAAAWRALRRRVSYLTDRDRVLHDDIVAVRELVSQGGLMAAVRAAVS